VPVFEPLTATVAVPSSRVTTAAVSAAEASKAEHPTKMIVNIVTRIMLFIFVLMVQPPAFSFRSFIGTASAHELSHTGP
jgi:hypothetical protein